MIYFFCFTTKNDFLSLFSRVWIEVHFPLKGKWLYIGSEAFCKIINVNQKQKRTKDGTLRYFNIDIFPCGDMSVEDNALFSLT